LKSDLLTLVMHRDPNVGPWLYMHDLLLSQSNKHLLI